MRKIDKKNKEVAKELNRKLIGVKKIKIKKQINKQAVDQLVK